MAGIGGKTMGSLDTAKRVGATIIGGLPGYLMSEPDTKGGVTKGDKEGLKKAEDYAAGENQNTAEYVGSLEKQAETAQGGVAAVDATAAAQREALRRQAAMALAASRGSFASPGGANLARLRASASQSGIDQGNVLAQAAKDRLTAQQAADAAQTELLEEKKKIRDAQFAADASLAVTDDWVQSIIAKNAGTVFTTEADRDRMISEIRNRVLPAYANNPAKYNRALAWIKKIEANSNDIDTDWTFEV